MGLPWVLAPSSSFLRRPLRLGTCWQSHRPIIAVSIRASASLETEPRPHRIQVEKHRSEHRLAGHAMCSGGAGSYSVPVESDRGMGPHARQFSPVGLFPAGHDGSPQWMGCRPGEDLCPAGGQLFNPAVHLVIGASLHVQGDVIDSSPRSPTAPTGQRGPAVSRSAAFAVRAGVHTMS